MISPAKRVKHDIGSGAASFAIPTPLDGARAAILERILLPAGPPPSKEHGLRWLFSPYQFLRDCAEKYGESFTLDLGSYGRFVLFSRPDAIREIFTGDPATFHAGAGNAVLEPFLGKGSLLLLEESRHLEERRLLLPGFSAKRVADHESAIREIALSVASTWQAGQVIRVQDAMQTISLEIILRSVFGLRAEEAGELRETLRNFLNDPKFNLALIGQLDDAFENDAWRAFRESRQRIYDLVGAELARRRGAATSDRGDFLGLLLGARRGDGSSLEDEALRDELLTLVVTGYETTATALAWAFTWMLRDVAVLLRLRGELAAAGGPSSAYLDAFCSEVLRIHPVIPLVARELRSPVTIGGFEIDAGTTVCPCIYLTHHRGDLYPEPDRFRPERFQERSFGPYEYLPFGGGARRCIGRPLALWEMKVVLASLVPRYELELDDPGRIRAQRRSVTIAPSGGPAVRVRSIRA